MMIMNLSTILEQLRGNSSTPGVDKSDVANYEPYASESGYGGGGGGGYGGYGSESGYGLSCASGYVNASAVALLAFLFLLNIVQDIVEDLTQSNSGRKKRESSSIEQFILDGGVEALVEGIPDVVVPLLYDLNDAVNNEDPFEGEDTVSGSNSSCVAESLCQANWHLNARYGGMGRVVGALLSNVVAKAFVGEEPSLFQKALEASKWGRRGASCKAFYPCRRKDENSTSGPY